MRWTPGNRDDIEDQRGQSGGGAGGRAVPLGIGGFIVVALLSWATGTNLFTLFDDGAPGRSGTGAPGTVESTPQEERMVDFTDAVAKDIQATWTEILGSRYQRTSVVLFRRSIESACGFAQSATGPFYCPGDRKVYLDLEFFDELSRRFGAPGDFADAYVVAHEMGHHVQALLGITSRPGAPASGPNGASVAMELQADCFAGVWGHAASQRGRFQAGRVELDAGDAEEALRAAASIGDDRLQKEATGHVAPERFTHGTSAQRMKWFQRGMDSGNPRDCDTGAAMPSS